jgi:predicted TIM-barrel fold metal-dependent hydrolase
VGRHPDIVQVILPSGSRLPYGDPHYHPIYEAAAEMDLPVAIHPGGDGLGIASPSAAGGIPTFYIEWHSLLCQGPMTHLVSLICQGVFEKFPTLNVVLVESGIAWLPGILWRLEANYKALRMEVPWVRRRPSEYVRDRVRFTTQPFDQPIDPAHLEPMLDMVGGKEMLLFASDYPHWDFDNPTQLPIPAAWRRDVFHDNARAFYHRLPRTAPVPAAAGA